ncbi:hypothetical protein JHK87_022655 [Glycine soja]|nr:hypothetical protein JHK87_022655 [Glycine soja]
MDVESNTYQDKVYGDPHKNGNLQLKYQDKVLRDRRIELTLEECEVGSHGGVAALRGAENERGSAVGGAWGGGVHGGGGGRSCAKRTWMRVLIFKASASGNLEAKRLHKQMFDLFDADKYIDDDQLVVNFKKQDPDLRWLDIMESWESLTARSPQLLQGTSIYIVGDSTEINQKGAQKLATDLGY